MQQSIDQMPLAIRIPALADMVRSTRSRIKTDQAEEARLMDQLAQAEAQVLGGEGEGVELSGLIGDGENPHYPGTGKSASKHASKKE